MGIRTVVGVLRWRAGGRSGVCVAIALKIAQTPRYKVLGACAVGRWGLETGAKPASGVVCVWKGEMRTYIERV